MLNNVLGTLKYDISAAAASLVVTPLAGTTFNLPPGGTDTTGVTTGAVATYGKPVETIILADRLDLSQAKYEIIQCTTRVPEAAGAYTHTVRAGGRGAESSTATAWTASNTVYVFQVTTAATIDLLASGWSMRAQAMIHHRETDVLDWNGTTFKFGIFRVISTGRGFHASSVGYLDITMPANGSVAVGYGGAANITAASGGWPLAGNSALYYEPDLANNLATSLATSFRVVSYTSDFVVPPHWIFIAVRPGLVGSGDGVRVCNGASLYPWVAPTLLNGWVNFNSGFDLVGYQKSDDGWVSLRGGVAPGTTAAYTPIFNLPAGYRPSGLIIVPAVAAEVFYGLQVDTSGGVALRAAAPIWVSLNSVRFRATQ
jgi:hypothetical protein